MHGLSPEDQSFVSRFGRGPKCSTPHATVHEAFESVVDSHPTAVAAVFGNDSITYLQLDLAANRLAHHLISSGLHPRQKVCLVVQRSIEMLVGFLAILKAGCQYVPIDGGVASDQALQHIFQDTETQFILCLPRYWDRVKQFASQEAIVLELGMTTGAFYPPSRPNLQVTANCGLFAMYTSGEPTIHYSKNSTDALSRKYWRTERCRRQTWYNDQRTPFGARTAAYRSWLKNWPSFEHLFRDG